MDTVIDTMPPEVEVGLFDLEAQAVPEFVVDVPTARIELAMEAAARAVERAFDTAQASAIGAMFEAIVDDAMRSGEDNGLARAQRVMNRALDMLKHSSRARNGYDTVDDVTKLYRTTPLAGEQPLIELELP